MVAHKKFSPNIWSAFSIVIMIVIWLAFAPTQVGGMASYIIVIGKSMEPNFHIGDLVVVHKQPIYQVGDAVVYRNLQLENFVFHRIISQQLGRYSLKGDNNSWVDAYQPSYGEVIGKLWLHIPRGGITVQRLRSPFVMALIAGALGAVLAAHWFGKKAQGNKRMNNKPVQEWFISIKHRAQNWFGRVKRPSSISSSNFDGAEFLEGSFFALAIILFSSLILGIIAFSRPASRTVPDDISYQHLGVFGYAASVPQGVYDANSIKSGDPIFTKLTCSVDVNFQYTLVAAQAENIKGTYQLTAVISEPVSGWQRVVPLQEETSFTGAVFGTTAALDLCKISALTQSMEQGTGFHPGTYRLVITPNIRLSGEASNRTLKDTFNSGLAFQYDRVHFSLLREEEQSNPLAVSETEILHDERTEANTLLLFGRGLSIPALRWLALIGLISSLCGLIWLELRLQNLSHLDRQKFLRIKYSSAVIDVQNTDALRSSSMIDLGSMDALAKLAERFNIMILHGTENGLHTYYVQAGRIIYRFRLKAVETELAVPETEVPGQEGGT
ncbi:MAG: signal peptidase I [Anaerolineales bacterium]